MNINVNIEIPLNPTSSPRPRSSRKQKYVTDKEGKTKKVDYTQTYMPTKYTKHKSDVRYFIPNLGLAGALTVTVVCIMPVPKSTSKKKAKEMIGTGHTKKPDPDNLAKTYLDACNGIVWIDDSQISKLTIEKFYGEEPKVLINVQRYAPMELTNFQVKE